MGQGNAITAKLGLDRSQFSKELGEAYKDAERKGKAAAGRGHAGGGEAREAEEGLFRGERRVEHAGVNLVRGLSQAKNGAEAFSQVAEGAVRALNIPLGASIALAGVGIAWEHISEAMEKTEEANKAAKAELEKPIVINMANPADGIKGIDEKVKQLQSSLSFKSYIGDKLTGGNGTEESVKLQMELEERKFEIAEKTAKALEEQGGIESAAAQKSQAYLALVKERFATEQKINAIAGDEGIPQSLKTALKEQARQQLEMKEVEFDKSQRLAEEEMGHANDLAYIRKQGDDADVKAAESNLAFAQTRVDLARDEMEARKAGVDVVAAQLEVDLAKKRTAAAREELALREKIANMAGPNSAKQRAEVLGTIDNLKRQYEAGTPDEKRALKPKLAESRGQLRDLDKADAARNGAAFDDLITAQTGEGLSEKAKATAKRIVLEITKLAKMGLSGTAETDEIAKQTAKVAGLVGQMREYTEQKKQAVQEAQEDGTLLELQGRHLDHAAELLKLHLDYAQKIKQAHKDGNVELEKQLRLNEQRAVGNKNAEFGRSRNERAQLSLGELAAHGTGRDGAEARKARDLEEKAHKEALHGHVDAAKKSLDQADAIKRGITSLKDSEKAMGDAFLGALDTSRVLSDIRDNTGKGLVNQ